MRDDALSRRFRSCCIEPHGDTIIACMTFLERGVWGKVAGPHIIAFGDGQYDADKTRKSSGRPDERTLTDTGEAKQIRGAVVSAEIFRAACTSPLLP